MLIIRGILGGIVQLAFLAALLVGPAGLAAGEWGWSRAWQFIAAYGVIMLGSVIALAIFAPASLEARLRPPASAAQPAEDKVATVALLLLLVLYLAFIPLDVFVWQILGQPSPAVSAIGAALFAVGYGLITWTIFVNSFAIPIVEDQTDQGQVVVDSGPYAVVRHPMYLGILPYLAGIGLWLGSWASVPLAAIVLPALAVRIRVEERTLLATLDGYADYCRRRRYRLVPLVW